MKQLSLTNIVNISVAKPGSGLSPFQVNNLAFITSEVPIVSVPSAGYFTFVDASSVAAAFGTSSETYSAAVSVFAQAPNILTGGGKLLVKAITLPNDYATGSVLNYTEAVQALREVVFFGGVTNVGFTARTDDALALAAFVQTDRVLAFIPTSSADEGLEVGGLFHDIMTAKLDHARCLYYSVSEVLARKFAAAYAGRALSCAFSGTDTTFTMHLKDLATIQPDPNISQDVYEQAQITGADIYAYPGVPKVITSGANGFFDDVYNLNWFICDLQVAGFNALAKVSNKVAQTEEGMSFLKSQYERSCIKAVRNGFVAPGAWTNADTVGDPVTFLRGISNKGYYLYSVPVVLQDPAEREQRKAPLVQIAIKFAGAIHSTSVLININL